MLLSTLCIILQIKLSAAAAAAAAAAAGTNLDTLQLLLLQPFLLTVMIMMAILHKYHKIMKYCLSVSHTVSIQVCPCSPVRMATYSLGIQLFRERVLEKRARDIPERYCGWF